MFLFWGPKHMHDPRLNLLCVARMDLSHCCYSADSLSYELKTGLAPFRTQKISTSLVFPTLQGPSEESDRQPVSSSNHQAREWERSRHPQRYRLLGNQTPAPVSARVTIGCGIMAPSGTGESCLGAHHRRRTAFRRLGCPTWCSVEYNVRQNTPQRAKGPTPEAKLPVALSVCYS